MVARLGAGPFGVVVQQDDGSVITVPPEVADTMAPIAPVTADAGPPPMPGDLTPPPTPAQDVPSVGQGGGAAPIATQAPGSPPGDNAAAAVPMGEVAAGSTQVPANAPTGAQPGMGAGPAPAPAPPRDPFEQEAAGMALASEAALAKARSDEATLAARNESLAKIQADRDRAAAADETRKKEIEAKYAAATDAYANHKIHEPEPKWNQYVAWTLGGIGASLNKSAENPVLKQWQAQTEATVRAQEADRDRLGALAQRAGQDLDRFVAGARDRDSRFALRMAGESERFARELEVSAARYGGAIAQSNAAIGAAQVRQKRDEWLAQAAERDWQHGQAEAQNKLERSRIGLGWATHKENVRQFDVSNQRAYDLATMETMQKAAAAQASGDIERAKLLQAQAKEERELAVGGGLALAQQPKEAKGILGQIASSAGKGKEAPAWFDSHGRLLDDTGAVWKAPDMVSAQKLRMQVGSSITAANLLDKAIRIRSAEGWTSDTLRSPEWQQLKALSAAVILEAKNAGELGALSGPDMKLIEDMMATGDVTGYRDPIAGLRQLRENLTLKTRNSLQTATYPHPERFTIPDMSEIATPPVDRDLSSAMTQGGRGEGAPAQLFGENGAAMLNIPKTTREQDLGLEALQRRLETGDKAAGEGLAALAQTAPNPEVRNLASAALLALSREGGNIVAAQLVERARGEIVGKFGRGDFGKR